MKELLSESLTAASPARELKTILDHESAMPVLQATVYPNLGTPVFEHFDHGAGIQFRAVVE